jgi:signal transduction histidine kinase/ActR/RegA family two-component response regulator
MMDTDSPLIETERIRSVLAQAPLTLGVTVINAALTGFVFASIVPRSIIWIWVALNIAISAARLGIRARFFRRGSDHKPLPLGWGTLSVIGSLATGLLWGLGAFVMFRASETDQLFLSFVIGGMCAGALSVNSAHWPTVLAFIIPATLPLAACFIIEGSTPRIAAAMMTILFAAALSMMAWRGHRDFGDRICLQLALAREQRNLSQANERLRAEMTQRQKAEALSVQAQKMEAVGQLTGGIAHDFNNLLQSIAGNLELIQHKPEETERVRRLAEAGLHAASRGAKLTQQLLAFSRSQKLEVKPLAVNKLLLNVQHLLDRTLTPAIRVRVDMLASDLRVLGDAVQLEMALLNLAINARDAMPQGGDLTFSARLRREAGRTDLTDGDYVEISVADTGPGMPPDVLSRAFDPFFTTKDVGQGSGLGLSQVYGTVHQAGGAVTIDSEPAIGTTVRLMLRCTDGEPMIEPDKAETITMNAFAATVLVVDDDPDVRRFLATSLETLGYIPIQAEDGYAGLAAIDRSAPDAVILDFAMPGINGAEVARQARAKRPHLPVIFATGYSDTAAIEAAANSDAPVLRKPFRLDELSIALAAALDQRLQQPTPRAEGVDTRTNG